MSDLNGDEKLFKRDMMDVEPKDEPSGKLRQDSFSMEKGSKLRHERLIDERTGVMELPSVRRRNEYRKRMKKEQAGKGVLKRPLEGAAMGTAVVGHLALSQDEDDSASSDAVHTGEEAALTVSESRYSGKVRKHSAYTKPTLEEKGRAVESASKKIQKKEIQKGYQSAKAGQRSAAAKAGSKAAKEGKAATKAGKETKNTFQSVANFIKNHPMGALALAGILFLIIIGASMCSTCASFFAGGGGAVSATSITAAEKDALSVEQAYLQMEQAKAEELEAMQTDYLENGIDSLRVLEAEVRYEPDLGHDPYELAALFTVLYGDYKEIRAKNDLKKIFSFQYETESDVTFEYADPEPESTEVDSDDSGNPSDETAPEKERCAKVVITLKNHGIRYAAERMGFTEEQLQQFDLLVYTRGNRPDLFDGYEFSDYEVPAKYLADRRFAAIYAEAKKHLGTKYVWGGGTPAQGFDCSGYVSYVLNHSGLYSFERTDCNGLLSMCTKVNRGNAKPGDLVFFEGTQDKYGATHVGIYLGDNMMIHASRPSVRYISLSNQYLKEHFMTFGRMPE